MALDISNSGNVEYASPSATPQDGSTWRSDIVTLIEKGTVRPAPMRMPRGIWALLITATDRYRDTDETGDIALFAGQWRNEPHPASRAQGDVVLKLRPPRHREPHLVDIELIVADSGRWIPRGTWIQLDHNWPTVVESAVTTLISLTRNKSRNLRLNRH